MPDSPPLLANLPERANVAIPRRVQLSFPPNPFADRPNCRSHVAIPRRVQLSFPHERPSLYQDESRVFCRNPPKGPAFISTKTPFYGGMKCTIMVAIPRRVQLSFPQISDRLPSNVIMSQSPEGSSFHFHPGGQEGQVRDPFHVSQSPEGSSFHFHAWLPGIQANVSYECRNPPKGPAFISTAASPTD